ncbi:MAG: HD domain-containing protein [Candidatus Firestonebacteria bacterium]
MNAEKIIEIAAKIADKTNVKIYITGGYLRDLLLQKKAAADIDFVVYKDAKKTAKAFARAVKGSFVELSDAFGIYRVICKEGFICDFSKGRGRKIEEDLQERDFTVNALAKEAHGGELIDIFDGVKDLKNGIIRETTGSRVYKKDPLRLLRAVRFAAALSFKLAPATEKNIKANAALISKPAKERVRDELFKLLETEDSAAYVELADKLGLLDKIFPVLKEMKGVSQPGFHHLDVFGHSLETLRKLEEIYLRPEFEISAKQLELLRAKMKEKSGQFDRSTFLKLTALLHDSGKPKTKSKDKKGTHFYNHELVGAEIFKKIGRQLKLSNEEINTGMNIIKCHLRTGYLAGLKKISKKAVYKFLRDTGDAALEVLLLSWADRLSARGVKVDKKTLALHKKVIEGLFEAYYKTTTETKKAALLNGHELMKHFKLSPSPLIGKLLEKAREAEATGKVKTKKEALSYLKRYI